MNETHALRAKGEMPRFGVELSGLPLFRSPHLRSRTPPAPGLVPTRFLFLCARRTMLWLHAAVVGGTRARAWRGNPASTRQAVEATRIVRKRARPPSERDAPRMHGRNTPRAHPTVAPIHRSTSRILTS